MNKTNKYFIEIEGTKKCNSSSEIKIQGQFNVPYNPDDDEKSKQKNILKSIILLITRANNHQVSSVFKNTVIFKDDLKDNGDSCSGVFNISLADHVTFDGAGDYYIICSLGDNLSNTLRVAV